MKIIIKYVLTKAMYVKERMFSSDENGAFDKNESRIEFKKPDNKNCLTTAICTRTQTRKHTVGARIRR